MNAANDSEHGSPQEGLPGDVKIRHLDVVMNIIDKAEEDVRFQIDSGSRPDAPPD